MWMEVVYTVDVVISTEEADVVTSAGAGVAVVVGTTVEEELVQLNVCETV